MHLAVKHLEDYALQNPSLREYEKAKIDLENSSLNIIKR